MSGPQGDTTRRRNLRLLTILALLVLGACGRAGGPARGPEAPTADPEFNWKGFLEGFSRDLLADESIRAALPEAVRESGWLGYEGATEEEIGALEARIGKPLPPSYRAFLMTSNGWRQTGAFIDRLYPAKEVEWFLVRNRDWIAAFTLGGLATLARPSVSDAEYFVYGDKQDPARGRWEYLEDALEISPEGDSAIYLLNPEVVFADGEWEAWFFANWLPGAVRYRSFREMMAAERALQVEFNKQGGARPEPTP